MIVILREGGGHSCINRHVLCEGKDPQVSLLNPSIIFSLGELRGVHQEVFIAVFDFKDEQDHVLFLIVFHKLR